MAISTRRNFLETAGVGGLVAIATGCGQVESERPAIQAPTTQRPTTIQSQASHIDTLIENPNPLVPPTEDASVFFGSLSRLTHSNLYHLRTANAKLFQDARRNFTRDYQNFLETIISTVDRIHESDAIHILSIADGIARNSYQRPSFFDDALNSLYSAVESYLKGSSPFLDVSKVQLARLVAKKQDFDYGKKEEEVVKIAYTAALSLAKERLYSKAEELLEGIRNLAEELKIDTLQFERPIVVAAYDTAATHLKEGTTYRAMEDIEFARKIAGDRIDTAQLEKPLVNIAYDALSKPQKMNCYSIPGRWDAETFRDLAAKHKMPDYVRMFEALAKRMAQ